MNNKSFDIQNEIRQNAMKAHDSIKGLKQWESEMKENELKVMKKLEQNNIEQQQKPPVRSKVEDFQNYGAEEDALSKMNSVSIKCAEEDNKTAEEKNNVMKRKQEAIDFKDKGNMFVKNKEYESAIKMYTRAIELCNDDPVFYSNRSQCYLSLEKYQECIHDATLAIQLDPKSTKSYYRRMTAYEKLGDDRKAMQSCSKLLDLNPEDTSSKNSYDRILNRILEADKKKDKEKIRWSRLNSNSEIINFVTKPPHLSSKKPMKLIPVGLSKAASPIPEAILDKIFENNTGETVPSLNTKLFKPKFLLSAENTTPKALKTNEKIETPRVENKKTLDIANEEVKASETQKNQTLLELESQKNHLITIPPTGPKFFAAWKELTDIQRFLYLKNFVDNNVPIGKLLGAQLNCEMLSEIISTIHDYFSKYNIPFIRLLNDLSQNSQASTLAMFLEDDEKKKLKDLLLSFSAGGDNEFNIMVSEIKECFQI